MSVRRMMLFTLGGFFKSIISIFKTRVLNDGGTFEAETKLENQLNTLGSTLFDSASLVITPSGVKTSKLYTIKPNDGTGDLTVTRNTSATRINESGNIVDVPANMARIDYSNGSPAILVEPQMTNIWTNNNNTNGYLNNTFAVKQNIVSDAFGIGFNGFQYSFVGGETFLSSNYNIKTFDTRNLPIQRLSLFIKNPSSDFLGIFFSSVEEVRFKFSTLEVSKPNNAYIKKINSNTYILYLYTNVASGAQYSHVRVSFVQSLTSSTTVNGSCILGLGFVQGLASGSLPNYNYSPIITNTGSVTRNADSISKTNVLNSSNDFTFYFEDYAYLNQTGQYFSFSTPFGAYLSRYAAAQQTLRFRYNSTNYAFSAPLGLFKFIIKKDNVSMKLFFNGTLTHTITTLPTGLSTFSLIESSCIKSMFFNSALTDTQAIQLTTL
jgi:hypothetical protein